MSLPLLLLEPRPVFPFLLLQSTAAQSIFPTLHALCNRPSVHTIIHNFLYDPSALVSGADSSTARVYDWTGEVPGYSNPRNLRTELLASIKSAPRDKPLAIVIDSSETLSENFASTADAYELLRDILLAIKDHPRPSQLIVHSAKPDETAELLLQTDFSSSLVHLLSHPTSLLLHISEEFMISPLPAATDIKFWSVFIPLSERIHEMERLCFRSSGKGCGSDSEFVVEVITRGVNTQSRKRDFGRVLEGWDSVRDQPCTISDLHGLKSLFSHNQAVEARPDPTQNLSFNLSLSESQQQSRARVPLPYAHEGGTPTGTIFYDPDSADDIDDDDPDEDLDI